MTVLDTFYILFKTNSDDVKKGMTEVEKKSKETEKALKGANDAVDDLGKGFLKMVEGGAALAGAWAGFNVIKSGVIDQTNYNAKLEQTARLSGLSAQNMKIMAQASSQAGGDRGGTIANIIAINQAIQSATGRGIGDPIKWITAQREAMKGLNQDQRNARYRQLGISDTGLQFLTGPATDKEFKHYMDTSKDLSKTSPEAFQKAFENVDVQAQLSGAIGKMDEKIATGLIPALDRVTAALTGGIANASGTTGGALGLAATGVGASGLWAAVKAKGALRALGLGGSAATAAETAGGIGLAGGAGALALGAAAVTVPYALGLKAGAAIAEHYKDAIISTFAPDLKTGSGAPLAHAVKTGNADLNFWMSKGYSKDQAAGIMANIQAESKGNPRATGDRGQAYGIGQWHPARAAAIKKGTGIDIYTANRAQQMQAMAWEMQNGDIGFDDKHFRGLQDARSAGSYFSTNFERPGDKLGQALSRGQSANQIASQYNGAGSTAVNIGAITINTQATNAEQIAANVHTALSSHLSNLAANSSDGVMQ